MQNSTTLQDLYKLTQDFNVLNEIRVYDIVTYIHKNGYVLQDGSVSKDILNLCEKLNIRPYTLNFMYKKEYKHRFGFDCVDLF